MSDRRPLAELLANVRIGGFWMCPVQAHDNQPGEKLRVIVEWDADGVAHCTTPGCFRTSRPQRIQRKRTAGWRAPEGAVYVGRPTFWGNPFVVGKAAAHRHRSGAHPYDFYTDYHRVVSADQAVGLYRKIITDPTEHQYVGHDTPTVDAIRAELAGKDLLCWCPLDQPCHADVMLELANTGGTV